MKQGMGMGMGWGIRNEGCDLGVARVRVRVWPYMYACDMVVKRTSLSARAEKEEPLARETSSFPKLT